MIRFQSLYIHLLLKLANFYRILRGLFLKYSSDYFSIVCIPSFLKYFQKQSTLTFTKHQGRRTYGVKGENIGFLVQYTANCFFTWMAHLIYIVSTIGVIQSRQCLSLYNTGYKLQTGLFKCTGGQRVCNMYVTFLYNQ